MSEALVLIFVLFAWLSIITVVAVVIRICRDRPTPTAIELEELWAKLGREEISRDEYDRRRRELLSQAVTAAGRR